MVCFSVNTYIKVTSEKILALPHTPRTAIYQRSHKIIPSTFQTYFSFTLNIQSIFQNQFQIHFKLHSIFQSFTLLCSYSLQLCLTVSYEWCNIHYCLSTNSVNI